MDKTHYTSFKRGLDAFRLHGYQANKLGHYWELSYDIFDRIDVSVSNRNSYVSYMKENPLVAKRKKVNIKGIKLNFLKVCNYMVSNVKCSFSMNFFLRCPERHYL